MTKILRADVNSRGRFAAMGEEEIILEVSVNSTYGERRLLQADHIHPHMNNRDIEQQVRQREYAIRDMARCIGKRIEEEIIEALQQKARDARPVHISDAFKFN